MAKNFESNQWIIEMKKKKHQPNDKEIGNDCMETSQGNNNVCSIKLQRCRE